MKKIIILVAIICVYLQAKSQTDTTSTETNHYFSAVKHIDWKGIGGQLSEYSYGFLKQGVNTVEGTYNSLKDLPNVLDKMKDLDVIDFSTYMACSVYEGVKNTVSDYLSGDPEQAGAAAFDVFMIVEGGRSFSRAGKGVASKYGPKYHYTSAEAAESIKKTGIKPGKSGEVYTTYDGTLSGTEAKSKLALPHETPPSMKITIDASVTPDVFRKVEAKFGQTGGGMEQVYYAEIGPDKIISVTPVEMNPSRITQGINLAGESSYYTPGTMMNATNDQAANLEGGHNLSADMGLVFVTENSIEQGGFKLLDENGTRYVIINPNDIDKLTPSFIGALSNSNDVFPKYNINRNREEVISGKRNQRGL